MAIGVVHAEEETPAALARLQEQRDRKIAEIDRIYVRELEELKVTYTKAGRLDDALAVDAAIKSVVQDLDGTDEEAPSIPLAQFLPGTKWIGQGGAGASIEFIDEDTFLFRPNDRGSGRTHRYSVGGNLLYLHWNGQRGAPCNFTEDRTFFTEKGSNTWPTDPGRRRPRSRRGTIKEALFALIPGLEPPEALRSRCRSSPSSGGARRRNPGPAWRSAAG